MFNGYKFTNIFKRLDTLEDDQLIWDGRGLFGCCRKVTATDIMNRLNMIEKYLGVEQRVTCASTELVKISATKTNETK